MCQSFSFPVLGSVRTFGEMSSYESTDTAETQTRVHVYRDSYSSPTTDVRTHT